MDLKKFSFIFLILALTLTGCANNQTRTGYNQDTNQTNIQNKPKAGGKITIGTTSVNFLDPLQDQTEEEKTLSGLIYNGLVRIDSRGNIQPDLAKSWNISDDGKTYTFYLRDDVKWHDGNKFSSLDVMKTWEYLIKNQQKASDIKRDYTNIRKVTTPKEDEFVVSLKEADFEFIYKMAQYILPASKIEEIIKPDYNNVFDTVGTGIYKVVEKNNDFVQLKKNKDYFGKMPYLEDITIVLSPDINILREAFDQAAIDVIFAEPKDWEVFQNLDDDKLYQYPSNYLEFIALNLNKEIFKDVKVRKAIQMAIDRDQILQEAIMGRGVVADGPILPSSWAHNPQIESISYNPLEAKKLLTEAGWSEGEDKVLEKVIQGRTQKLEFNLMVNLSNSSRYQAAMDIEKNLKAVGISANIVDMSWDELKTNVLNKKYDAAIMGWKLSPSANTATMFSTKAIRNGFNFVAYSNPELDKLFDQINDNISDEQKKTSLYKIQEIITQDLPYIFLYSPNNLIAISNKIKGIESNGGNIIKNIDSWWVE